jgi:hypothetical protein
LRQMAIDRLTGLIRQLELDQPPRLRLSDRCPPGFDPQWLDSERTVVGFEREANPRTCQIVVHSMTPTDSSRPSLSVRPCQDGSGWYVEAWWPNRRLEKLGHFRTHSEAREWVALESASFFVLREIGSSVKAR